MARNVFNTPEMYEMMAGSTVGTLMAIGHIGDSNPSEKPPHLNDPEDPDDPHKHGHISKDVSALYGLLAVVSGLCVIPVAEMMDNFDADFLRWGESMYMIVSILFLLYCFAFLFRPPSTKYVCGPAGEIPESPTLFDIAKLRIRRLLGRTSREDEVCVRISVRQHLRQQALDSGSLYLKVGCAIFGVGSVVYCSIILGVYAENLACFNVVFGINPTLLVLSISLQLLFIFRNSQFTITKYTTIGRLGLMHLVVMNLLICVRVMVDETTHSFREIAEHDEAEATARRKTVPAEGHAQERIEETSKEFAAVIPSGAYFAPCVSDLSIMKQALSQSTIFLYPCIIEYALISAGIVFTMWRGVGEAAATTQPKKILFRSDLSYYRARSSWRINCDQAMGGMFAGLLVIACVIGGLIVFFVAKSNGIWGDDGTLDWQIMDIILLSLGTGGAGYCFFRFITKLDRVHVHSFNAELDDNLLLFSMIGVYAYCIASLLGATGFAGTLRGRLSIICNVLTLVQTTLQSVFLFDAAKRGLKIPPQNQTLDYHKPGRQMLTFMLILNFALWLVHVFCNLRIDVTPCQREFYGPRMWALITHITVPLIIFYRFHSTACIFEVWKRAYREPKQK